MGALTDGAEDFGGFGACFRRIGCGPFVTAPASGAAAPEVSMRGGTEEGNGAASCDEATGFEDGRAVTTGPLEAIVGSRASARRHLFCANHPSAIIAAIPAKKSVHFCGPEGDAVTWLHPGAVGAAAVGSFWIAALDGDRRDVPASIWSTSAVTYASSFANGSSARASALTSEKRSSARLESARITVASSSGGISGLAGRIGGTGSATIAAATAVEVSPLNGK